MFNRARWWSEKNKIKVVFRLQFRASQLPQIGGDGLIISVVPADAGKPTLRSDRAPVRDGSCFWENPVFETVKFSQDPKSGKILERIYYFVAGTGSSKAGVVGEASIDFSSYSEASKVTLVSLPLKSSKKEAVLHVSIQRIQESTDEAIIRRNSLQVMLSNNTVSSMADSNVNHQASCESDITMSSSETSSGISEPQMKNNDNACWELNTAPTPISEQHQISWEWVENSTGEDSTDSSRSPRETYPKNPSKEDPGVVIEKLKCDLAVLSRQAETSELELQALRRQIMKENKRGQDHWEEIVSLKEERDALKSECCEQFKASQRQTDEEKIQNNLLCDAVNSQSMVMELREELDHAKELNANLRIQLQKTQDSNSELILAVQDLEDMLENKNREMPYQSSESLTKGIYKNFHGRESTICQSDGDDDVVEQKALEELVMERGDSKEAHHLEQHIMDLQSEIEIYRRDKDEIQMQLEQLALDYEILMQENHDLSCRLEQCQVREKLAAAHELEIQMENLENELDRRSKEYEDSLVTINELEAHAMSLMRELDKQAQGFEADLEVLTCAKVEQEKRALRAEETLKRLQQKNANTAERLQEEVRRLSLQMTSTFEANEKLAAKALAEANELQSHKSRLEEILRSTSEEHQSVKSQYDARLGELVNQITLMTNEIEQMKLEIVDKAVQLDYHKKHAEETLRVLSEKNLMLKDENKLLLEDKASNKNLVYELELMRKSINEKDLLVERVKNESIELKSRTVSIRNETDDTHKELNKMRCQAKEKESVIGNLQAEVDFLQAQITELKRSLLTSELEKEKLRKQVSQILKRGDTIKNSDKKIKDGIGRRSLDMVKGTSKTSKPVPHGPKEVTNLKERIKWLEGQIKLKESALERSAISFLEKEKDLHNNISELKGKLEVLDQSSRDICLNEVKEIPNKNESAAMSMNNSQYVEELKTQIGLLKERNSSMEVELRDMHERYSEITLKFAEVEGERQQLVMKLRSLANVNKSH